MRSVDNKYVHVVIAHDVAVKRIYPVILLIYINRYFSFSISVTILYQPNTKGGNIGKKNIDAMVLSLIKI